jgi:glycyl-tRNA synthetase
MSETRSTLENLEIQRFFFAPSFELYGSVAGLWDLGPVGNALERNLLARWREHFVIFDDMCEVRCSMLTPYSVLESSGHTAKFADYMVSDTVKRQLYRADQLIEQVLKDRIERSHDAAEIADLKRDRSLAGDLNGDGLDAMIQKHNILSPDGNPLSRAIPFNLMFNTMIGPGERAVPGFLRPETAQGIFVNFPRLFEFQKRTLPFACAQIGVSYRNEIAPRNALVRCREFMMAEIEHFADPTQLNNFPKFEKVKNLRVMLFPTELQEQKDGSAIAMLLSDAVEQGLICHKTMGYFIGRTYLFMISIGIDPARLRFRQHRNNEKAHYARDCWDAEIEMSLGWVECAGLADRQSFDLSQHSQATRRPGEKENTLLCVQVPCEAHEEEHGVKIVPNKGMIGKIFKADGQQLCEALTEISGPEAQQIYENIMAAEVLIGGRPAKGKKLEVPNEVKEEFERLSTLNISGHEVTYEMYTVTKSVVTVTNRTFIPCVIEPSFGIGRIMTAVLEHSFYLREDGVRRVLRLRPEVAPYKCVVLPLSNKFISIQLIDNVRDRLREASLAHQVDSGGASIGKRYARTDELGIPFAITLDLETISNGSVTLRERDSCVQVRVNLEEAIKCIQLLCNGLERWEGMISRFPIVSLKTCDE